MSVAQNTAAQKQNQAALRRIIEEGFNKGNYAALDALFAANYKEHQFGLKTTLEGFKEDIQYLRTGFPDLHLTIDDMIASEDTVWVRMTASGTHTGRFMGPPTGRLISMTLIDVCRFENGKLVEHWGVPDRFALLAFLGLPPQPGPSS